MNQPNPFRDLRFELRRPRLSPRVIPAAAAFVLFTVLWLAVPQAALYWLLLPFLLVLAWATSFGWRGALASLIEALHSLLEL